MTREELLRACFGDSAALYRPGPKVIETRLVRADGKETGHVISHLDVYWRRVVVGLTTVNVAAIGNVCTDPEYRGRGYATSLLRRAHTEIREHPAVQWAALFALDVRLFERNGYRQVDPAGVPDLLVAKMGDESWPAGRIDTQGEW